MVNIKNSEYIKALTNIKNVKVYKIGGAVRDEFLDEVSKDLDILITGIPFDDLDKILSKYGKTDVVGKSFGVLKFKPKDSTEDIDVAIPRMERPNGNGGHKGFDVYSDHTLPIEKDLERRDFTMNAIAKDINDNIIDPFNGIEDIKNKIIRVVNPEAFSDDPLRMLRSINFASRFNFKIEPKTMNLIKQNVNRINEIPAERILVEFDKIIRKGDILLGIDLLRETGLFKEIFSKDIDINREEKWSEVETMGEFIFLITKSLDYSPSDFYRDVLKGDLETVNEIKAYELAFEKNLYSKAERRLAVSKMYKLSPKSLFSKILPENIRKASIELLCGRYPLSLKELAVDGHDLMTLGITGKLIKDTQNAMLLNIYSDKLNNNTEDLLKFCKKGYIND